MFERKLAATDIRNPRITAEAIRAYNERIKNRPLLNDDEFHNILVEIKRTSRKTSTK